MGDLSKLKLALGQMEIVEGRPSVNERARDAMIERALDAGADALVVPNSLTDESDVGIIGLNDTRIDVSGDVVELFAHGDTYRIGRGEPAHGCDISITADLFPYTVLAPSKEERAGTIVLRPVGIRDCGKKVFAYDGGTTVRGSDGSVLLSLRDDFAEDFAVVDFSRPRKEAGSSESKLLDAVVTSLRRFDAQALSYGPKWVIGLSGGLDSSITAALLVLALGKDRVVSYNMATRYNSDLTKSNAAKIADALDIPLRNGSIEGLVVSLGNTLVQYGYPQDALKGLVLENVQARVRGNLLSTFSAVENGVVINNGNRVECALGYATLYGDAIGAFAPIGDLTKVQLFDLAHQINARFGREVVPENLLPVVSEDGFEWEMMPSAELANGQRDPMKWFYHDWLIGQLLGDGADGALPLYDCARTILEQYAASRLLDTDAARWVKRYGLDDPKAFAEDFEWVMGSMQRAAFKRIQAPPVLTLASKASVLAPQESQTRREPPLRYNALLSAIRSMK